MHQRTAPAGGEQAPGNDFAALSTALILSRGRALRGAPAKREPAGYQRWIDAWVIKESGEYLVLHRELLSPYDADREAVEAALPPGLTVLDSRPMPLREGETGGTVCLRIGPPPPPAEEEACAA
jgi:hypothetical protein